MAAPGGFAHLHVHTEYSMLDGASKLDGLIAAAAADGQTALGITDHGNMYGVLDFYQGCQDAGIKPIIGTEAYMAHDSRHERPPRRGKIDDSGGDDERGRKLYYHLTLLAENDIGYKNLIQVASRSFLEGYYYKPRCDWEILADHSEGLIATSGCLGGQVPQALLKGDEKEALARAGRLRDIFGPDNFFIEIQDHHIPDQRRIIKPLLEIGKKLGAPLLATNDSHYTHRHDAEAHDILLCVQTNSQRSDPGRFKFNSDQHYLKTAAEMRALFADGAVAGACDNTLLVAERADVTIGFGDPQLPDFPLPDGFADSRAYLQHLSMEGAKERWGDPLPDRVIERIAYELDVINNMGFASYFLITWDLIRHARELRIRVGPGRGSAAGCAVAYALKITDLDPIRYNLLFERFLNPDRVSMPDIDMDFDSRYRDEMIRYAAERYGRDRVAQIITFSQIKARAAVRDAARVLGKAYSVGDRIAKSMPPLMMGRDTPLDHCLKRHPEWAAGYEAAAGLREMVASDPEAAEVVEAARGLEGLRRQDSIHAAAVVITKEPLTEHLPIQRKPESGKDPEDAPIVTQYEMHGVEKLGLLKMDFLGLRNLDVITDCLEMVGQTRRADVDIDNVDLEDGPTYEMLRRGETVGVFQLESKPMRALLKSLAPTCFDDIAALVALYRPGPMAHNIHNDYADRKNGRQEVEFIHPEASEILGETYGLMIYQEDVMRMAQRFAGYSLAEADSLRKAMGKKIRSVMAQEREKFVSGVDARGYGRARGEEMFGIIEQFADYAFNKSHSYGYGYIAYQTAYLKANYPTEYMAALLSSVRDKSDNAAVYLGECQRMAIEVAVPDVNTSGLAFTPIAGPGGRIAFGLSAIRNVGEGLAGRIISERAAGGPYGSFHDFADRSDPETLNSRAVSALIQAGAFDSLGHARLGLLEAQEKIVESALRKRREADAGVISLFGDGSAGFDERAEIGEAEMPRRDRMAAEKQMLGMHISDHPLNGVQAAVDCGIPALSDMPDGRSATVCGVVSGLRFKPTRAGGRMALCSLEDKAGAVDAVMFGSTLEQMNGTLANDSVLWARGRVENREQMAKLLISEAKLVPIPEQRPDRQNRPARARIDIAPGLSPAAEVVRAVKQFAADHPGPARLELRVNGEGGGVLRLPEGYDIDPNAAGAAQQMLDDMARAAGVRSS